MPERRHLTRNLLLLGLGVIAGTVGVIAVRSCSSETEAERRARARQRFWKQKVTRVLAAVEEHEKDDVQLAMAPVEAYFSSAEKGTRPFAKSVLSWEAKRTLLAAKASTLLDKLDSLPSWLKVRWLSAQLKRLADALDRKGFCTYVKGRLEQHVFSRAGIEAAILMAMERYRKRLETTDRAVLARVMKDSGKLPRNAQLAPRTELALKRRYEEIRRAIVAEMLEQTSVAVGREVLMATTQKVGGKALIALATFGLKEAGAGLGLLTAGATSAWWSFGIGLAVAVLGNWAIDYFLEKTGNSPEDKIHQKMSQEVKRVRGCVIDGCQRKDRGKDVQVIGLKQWLERYRVLWVRARTKALRKLVLHGPA